MNAFFKKGLAVVDVPLYKIARIFFKTPELIETARQLFTFIIIGVVNSVIDFGIYYFLTRHTTLFNYHTSWRYVANSISFLTATTFSFWMNRWWTFRRTEQPTMSEVLRFYTTTVGGLLVNNTILFSLSSFIGINDLVAKVFSTLFSSVWNFIFKKLWVFTPATQKDNNETAVLRGPMINA
jgi:putative flippase GtrA